MARSSSPLQQPRSAVTCYGLATIYVAAAVASAFLLQRFHFRDVQLCLLLFAVALAAWQCGPGPAALSIVLSILSFDYLFTIPYYSFLFTLSDLPSILVLTAFGILIAWFSSVRRQIERELIRSRDQLQVEVMERSQQASLLNLTHDTIFVRDMNDVITYWNRGAQELYGWEPAQAIGKRSPELLKTVFPIPEEEVRAELLRTDRWEGELKRTTADGTVVIVASRWSLRRGERNQPAAIMETNNDITERNRREEEIRNLNLALAGRSAALEAANKELEAFAYSVSHDLRAPLRHMAGYSELLQKKAAPLLDEKGLRYMGLILASAKRMGNLIDDLLSFSRISRAETQKTHVNMEQLVREAVSEVRQDAEGREIVWKVSPLPVCYGDRSMLRLVLVNLLANAVKFTRRQPRAEIEIGYTSEDRDEVMLFVKDNGAGFDMKYVNKLFGVFQRLHQTDAFEGTGIGLATVARIIHRHGGEVRAEGAVNQGATFYFSVPKR